ncbi:hypothetical protein PAXRUDRAFT_161431 [Paxillus rubicundulus Ve08.2h10]|uniref:Uncharacterized protein n=1 Tax=Paxillus rubicundulus Ve08.2h10 TaxID=930991 RepID=A0A0D0CV98_9AGAM|nr:hypothetical protein PAXRUDRAFT_161431 [Paxillus rubicundulus Ve08.2h10]
MEAGPSNQQDGLWYNCICAKYNFGHPHLILSMTWYCHLQEVSSDEEQQRMLIAKSQLHPPANPPTDGRSRGAVGCRRNNVLPTQKQGREIDGSHRDSADPEPHMHKRGRQQDRLEQSTDQVCPLSPPRLPMPPPSPPQLPVPPPSPPQQPIPPPSPPRLPGANINIIYECRPCLDIDLDELERSATFRPMSDTLSFIWALRNASITDPVAKLSDEGLNRLHNPPTTPLIIDNPGVQLSISTYLAHEHLSQASYKRVCRSCKLNFASAPGADEILSYHNVEKLIRIHTGVEALLHDMCCNTSHAFTGPYSALDECYICQTSRWNEEKLQGSNGRVKVPAQQFTTIPLGPQLQACNRSPEAAYDMQYLWECTQKVLDELRELNGAIPIVDDVVMGWGYLRAVLDGDIKKHDIV